MDYERLRVCRNRQNAFANMIGLTITEIGQGSATVKLPITPDHLNPTGTVHGGCLATVADVAAGAAASSYGRQVTTVDGSLHYLRAGLNTTCLYGHAKELKHGKRLSVFEITIQDQDGRVLTEGIFTYMHLDGEIPLD